MLSSNNTITEDSINSSFSSRKQAQQTLIPIQISNDNTPLPQKASLLNIKNIESPLPTPGDIHKNNQSVYMKKLANITKTQHLQPQNLFLQTNLSSKTPNRNSYNNLDPYFFQDSIQTTPKNDLVLNLKTPKSSTRMQPKSLQRLMACNSQTNLRSPSSRSQSPKNNTTFLRSQQHQKRPMGSFFRQSQMANNQDYRSKQQEINTQYQFKSPRNFKIDTSNVQSEVKKQIEIINLKQKMSEQDSLTKIGNLVSGTTKRRKNMPGQRYTMRQTVISSNSPEHKKLEKLMSSPLAKWKKGSIQLNKTAKQQNDTQKVSIINELYQLSQTYDNDLDNDDPINFDPVQYQEQLQFEKNEREVTKKLQERIREEKSQEQILENLKNQFPEQYAKLNSYSKSTREYKKKRDEAYQKICGELGNRKKTFAKFGFKCQEKTYKPQIREIVKMLDDNSYGSMQVNDLWSEKSINRFLGGCKLIRDKIMINKMAEVQKKQGHIIDEVKPKILSRKEENKLIENIYTQQQSNLNDLQTQKRLNKTQMHQSNSKEKDNITLNVINNMKKSESLKDITQGPKIFIHTQQTATHEVVHDTNNNEVNKQKSIPVRNSQVTQIQKKPSNTIHHSQLNIESQKQQLNKTAENLSPRPQGKKKKSKHKQLPIVHDEQFYMKKNKGRTSVAGSKWNFIKNNKPIFCKYCGQNTFLRHDCEIKQEMQIEYQADKLGIMINKIDQIHQSNENVYQDVNKVINSLQEKIFNKRKYRD